MKTNKSFVHKCRVNSIFFLLFMIVMVDYSSGQNHLPLIPAEERGRIDMEREGTHDANKIRTLFYNFGMVGDYPSDPLNVDVSIFHSVEVPKGSGENYSDGTTPFVLSKVIQENGKDAYIMLTGYRERQGTSPITNKTMRFEPRPGYFQTNPDINKGRSAAMSNDSRTWPDEWIDKRNDLDDPGWKGWWNGYFGKLPKADQESFVVYDDNYYDAWNYFPDSRDKTRRGLGLKVEQRGFQWANPQSGYVIFFHYDIANESTTMYNNNVIFGLYMDSGVGGSAIGIDGIPESDDDNAFFDKEAGLNLVYTWDKNGNGFRGTTGYLGYSYLETPGNPFDNLDNDDDGMFDEKRDGGAGNQIIGQEAIKSYIQSNYDLTRFETFWGPLEKRPAYILGSWWTGDEDLDWMAEFHDTGADGIFGTFDTGENDGKPTNGETNFDKTDIDESDQIGLTGFKLNRIRAGVGNSDTKVDQIVFFDDGKQWPKRLFNIFTNPDSTFDKPLALNYNIGFLFASGPFILNTGKTERFSLALGYGKDLRELRNSTKVVLQIYKANYQFAVPPPTPKLEAFTGDGFITLTWDDAAERAYDPVTNKNDFEGYRIYRSTDPSFLDPQVIFTGTGTGPLGNGKPIAQFDLIDDIEGFSRTTVEGVAYFLGEDTGLSHTFTDRTVVNGQKYFYAVTSYDTGEDSIEIYPSESAISVSQTLRGGTILPKNVVEVTANPPVPGYVPAKVFDVVHSEGNGYGKTSVGVLNSKLVPDNHLFEISFTHPDDSVHASFYRLVDVTENDTIFSFGRDFDGEGKGSVGLGLIPVIKTVKTMEIDSVNTGFVSGSKTNVKYRVRYSVGLPVSLRRVGYPENIYIQYSSATQDTSIAAIGLPAKPTKFKIIAKSTLGDIQMDFRFRNVKNTGVLSEIGDYLEILSIDPTNPTKTRPVWRIDIDTTGMGSTALIPPADGDLFKLMLKVPYSKSDKFTFRTTAQILDEKLSKEEFDSKPFVVPNPYVGSASFEPQRFAVSGRGERKIEFRNIPLNAEIRIYTINGELVQQLRHEGFITDGTVSWDLRNKDQLEVAPGLYIYHVDGGTTGKFTGKFAIIK
ncbi:MAG: hypothetical protein CVV23_14325 [Ignavibacteriae bacterium HGW-Ignavibacteriae-2]|jgi:hypothetical protein|nr:MAG: hypothetical protein CVV23_14325 [Ignavibacteriae bacterium HGW-Ignavibacteriae-2]